MVTVEFWKRILPCGSGGGIDAANAELMGGLQALENGLPARTARPS
jgi:hypothetical protein